jgi:hypothetical protein
MIGRSLCRHLLSSDQNLLRGRMASTPSWERWPQRAPPSLRLQEKVMSLESRAPGQWFGQNFAPQKLLHAGASARNGSAAQLAAAGLWRMMIFGGAADSERLFGPGGFAFENRPNPGPYKVVSGDQPAPLVAGERIDPLMPPRSHQEMKMNGLNS